MFLKYKSDGIPPPPLNQQAPIVLKAKLLVGFTQASSYTIVSSTLEGRVWLTFWKRPDRRPFWLWVIWSLSPTT